MTGGSSIGGPGGPGGPGGLPGPGLEPASDPAEGPDNVTVRADDITRLNGMAVERAGAFARLAGIALIAAGTLGVLAWLWISVRQQQRIDDLGSPFSTSEDPSLIDRLDAFVEYVVFLPWSAVTIGAGFGLRLAADYATARSGGSLSGFTVGDPVPDGGLSHEPEQIEVDPFA